MILIGESLKRMVRLALSKASVTIEDLDPENLK
jgi:hypothetical protein